MAKRWFPVLLLLVASVQACAQGATAFMQGVSLRMGFKDGDNAAIPNAPFQADVVVTMTQTLGDGNLLSREIRGKAQRDSAGRFRWQGADTTNDGKVKPEGMAQSIILDPVAKRELTWTNFSKDLHSGPLLAGSNISIVYTSYTDGREHLRKDVPDVTTKDLGTKKISGLTCTGTFVTTTIPVDKMGNEKPIVITDESWRSTELQMVVERVVKDPLIGTRRVEFQNVTRSEPEPSAFQPPDGYTLKNLFSMPPPGMPPAPGFSTSPNF